MAHITSLAYDNLDDLMATVMCDGYDHDSIKYFGVLLMVFNEALGRHDQYMLSFERLDSGTDASTKRRLEEVLTRFGVKKFFDEKVRYRGL